MLIKSSAFVYCTLVHRLEQLKLAKTQGYVLNLRYIVLLFFPKTSNIVSSVSENGEPQQLLRASNLVFLKVKKHVFLLGSPFTFAAIWTSMHYLVQRSEVLVSEQAASLPSKVCLFRIHEVAHTTSDIFCR